MKKAIGFHANLQPSAKSAKANPFRRKYQKTRMLVNESEFLQALR
jgi:hypothetical protein